MKKTVVIMTLVAVTGMAQAATLTWSALNSLQDTQSGQGSLFGGTLWALQGVDLYLIHNGVGGSFAGVEFDTTSGNLELAGTDTALSWFDTYITDATDEANGTFTKSLTGVDLTSFGETVLTWEAMNTRSFTILAIKDTDGGDYSTGAWYGTYTGTPNSFSTASGDSGEGFLSSGDLDASGSGLINVVPEPATAMLLALGGSLAWLVRLKQRLS